MKNKKYSGKIKSFFIVLFCGLIFFFSAYLYLDYNIAPEGSKADTTVYKVPYSKNQPDDAGIAFAFPDGRAVLIFLDFGQETVFAALIDEYSKETTEYFGYPVTYTAEADYDFLTDIIDRVGGIELEVSGERLRYTGIQITELISLETDTASLMRDILSAVLTKISENGFNNDDFVFIIENTETNLTIPDCYYWPDYLGAMCRRAVIIN